ncbi:YbjN domain-containing protein [Aeromicrobium sp. 50.2.37]|uniref:YbjN domain-containing protein n=1 Tax=Aeromicrobium sp. 50.2.37 TaxID=2969305 RepID=UPI00214F7CA5|nr:YbjN domain-containing protein [Aeromicrobium sp. 50.2.37]MCR4513760.1 YbjN domain-containing protein [Aeromicrobium sp. 50.2.37]
MSDDLTTDQRQALEVILDAVASAGLDHVRHGLTVVEVDLPGERKLKTTTRLDVGRHTLGVHAFVARNPDENHEGVYRWLLERNLKLYGVAFAIDSAGDVYLDGRLPLHSVTAEEVDRLLGAVLSASDDSFNTILELGFASSIRKEWAWRESRGESTANLAAFEHLRPKD